MPNCIVKSCSFSWRTRTDARMLHTFPRNRERIRKWLEKLNVPKEDLEYFLERIATSGKGLYRICSRHFKDTDYEIRGPHKVLKYTAYPTLHLEDRFEKPNSTNFTNNRADVEHDYYKRLRTDQTHTSHSSSNEPSKSSLDGTLGFIETSSPTSNLFQCSIAENIKCDLEETQYVDCILFKSSASGDFPTEPSSEIPISDIQKGKMKYCQICSHGLLLSRKPKVKTIQKKVSIGTQCSLVDLPPLSLLPTPRINQEGIISSCDVLSDKDASYPSQVEEQFKQLKDEEFYINCADAGQSVTYLPPDVGHSNMAKQKKFLVFEQCLEQLLMSSRCMHDNQCNGQITGLQKYMVGSALVVYAECSSKHKFKLWTSQPFIGHVPVGNLLLSAAILCSGFNFLKMETFFSLLEMVAISANTHYNNQKNYLFPTIEHHWSSQRSEILKQIGQQGMALLADCQFNSPAKYCTYALLDAESYRVLDFQVEQLHDSRSSVSLENVAFVEVLNRILSDQVRVKVIATDRNVSIRNIIKKRYPHIKHMFDMWYMARSVGAKLKAASKKKNCRELSSWVPLAKKHLWWAFSTCHNNPILLKEKWLSIIYHSANVHEWTGNAFYHRCIHPPIPNDKGKECGWLTPGSAAHRMLKSTVQDSRLLKDLDHLSIFNHTGEIEVFHRTARKYYPKHHRFFSDAMVARTQLAVMDHNQSISRPQAVILSPKDSSEPEGNLHYHKDFSKAKKVWVVNKMYQPTSQAFRKEIISDAVDFAAGLRHFPWKSRQGNSSEHMTFISRPQTVV